MFAGRESGVCSAAGADLDLAIRTTRYFRFEADDRRWRQVHHHGSIDDPHTLRAYQEMIRGAGLAADATGGLDGSR